MTCYLAIPRIGEVNQSVLLAQTVDRQRLGAVQADGDENSGRCGAATPVGHAPADRGSGHQLLPIRLRILILGRELINGLHPDQNNDVRSPASKRPSFSPRSMSQKGHRRTSAEISMRLLARLPSRTLLPLI
jgi:hypothetical protein